MSLRVVICDDDGETLSRLEKLTEAYCAAKGLAAEIQRFSSGEAFVQNAKAYDLLLMDVYLPGMTGIQAVRQSGAALTHPVVFITTSRDFAVEAFGLKAVHYLLKPVTQEGAYEALDRCLEHLRADAAPVLQIKTGHDTVPVPAGDINYVEVYNKISVIHLSTGDLETYTPLDSLFEQLQSQRFMKAQRSFIVNMGYIESFFYDRLLLKNGVEVTLSRSNRSELKAQYQRYLFRLARGQGA